MDEQRRGHHSLLAFCHPLGTGAFRQIYHFLTATATSIVRAFTSAETHFALSKVHLEVATPGGTVLMRQMLGRASFIEEVVPGTCIILSIAVWFNKG
jgi:hypothetical protein